LSFYDESLARIIATNILADPEVCCGMRVTRFEQQATPSFEGCHTFKVGSPVLARGEVAEGKIKHYIHSDTEADQILTATLRHKIDKAGLGTSHNQVTVSFDRTYRNPKTKLVTIKDIANRASICPVIIKGTPEAVQFAWNVGVGHGTGSGFGFLI
jgi:CRISPR-associated endoribonuclease Cas6